MPDGKFLVADSLLPFGSKPFQAYREILQAGANGPSKGGASKAMEFVEFADFECPHCKEAQPIVAKLLADYPSAHFVYQDFPLSISIPKRLRRRLTPIVFPKPAETRLSSSLQMRSSKLRPALPQPRRIRL